MRETNPYLSLVEGDVTQERQQQVASNTNAPPVGNPYAVLVEADVAQETRASLAQSVDIDPDKDATLQGIAKRYNLPISAVRLQAPEMERKAKLDAVNYGEMAKTNPVLSTFLTAPSNAAVAHDDIENMGALETAWGKLGNVGKSAFIGLVPSFNQGFYGTLETASAVTGFKSGQEYFGGARQRQASLEQSIKDTMVGEPGYVEQAIYGGFQSLGQLLPSTILSVLTGNPTPVLATAGIAQGGQSAGKALDAGKDPLTALIYGTSDAAIEIGTEAIPTLRLLGDLKVGTPFLQTLTRQIAAEIPNELAATTLQNLNEWAVLHPEAPFSDYLKQLPADLGQTVIATVVATGAQTGAAYGAYKLAGKLSQSEQAQTAAEALQEVDVIASTSKLRERDPSAFKSFTDGLAQSGVNNLYIDPQVFNQIGVPPEQLAAISPQIAEAIATGGDVVIPVSDFVTNFSGTELGQALIPHVRATPDGMSLTEAEEFKQNQAAEFEKAAQDELNKVQETSAFKQSQQAVYDNLLGQLQTTGRFSSEVNAEYATLMSSFYAVQAARLGTTPEEMFTRFPVVIQAQSVAGPQLDKVVNQSSFDFRKDYIEAYTAAKDMLASAREQGYRPTLDKGRAALEVYHGTSAQAAESINASGSINAGSFFSFRGSETEYYAKTKNKGGNVLAIKVDPRDIEYSTGTGEIYAPEGLVRGEDGVWRSPRRTEARNAEALNQGPTNRGSFNPYTSAITLLKNADLSTFLHESGHFYLETLNKLATDQSTPQEFRDDMNAVLRWFGIEGATPEERLAAWNGYDLEKQRDMHEQFARGFEAYLFEGRAPSVELRGLFEKFRAWLMRVYRTMLSLNAELNSEVRSVFDRMLATADQIAQAEAVREMTPAFESAAQAKMTEEEFKAYQDQGLAATQEALSELQTRSMRDMKWLSNAKSRALKNLQKDAAKKRKAIREEATREVMTEPVYRARQWLKRGETVSPTGEEIKAERGYKLDITSLEEIYGGFSPETVPNWKQLGYGKYGMLSDKGLHPDIVAEMFGFTSGDALVKALLEASDSKTIIGALTDRRMLERYADLSDPVALQEAADKAVHNVARAKFVATELNALERALSGRKVRAEAAKIVADNMIARVKVGDLRPTQYAKAEARAARAALEAVRKDDIATAAAQKRNQLVQNYATRAAYDAQDDINNAQSLFRRILSAKDDTASKTRNMDLVNAARAVLAQYGYGTREKDPAAYMNLVREYDPDLYAVLEPTLIEASNNTKSWEDLTVAEFRVMRVGVESLWRMSRREKQMEIDGKLISRDAAAKELLARLGELGAPDTPQIVGRAATETERLVRGLQGVDAAVRRVESWVDFMDGGKTDGAFRKYLFNPVKQGADEYRFARKTYVKKFRDLLDTLAPTLKPGRIDAPELRYTFGYSKGDMGKSELLHALIHTGNESNKRKLLLGYGWGSARPDGSLDSTRWDTFIARMFREGRITKADMDFVQGVWDLLEELKPKAQETHRKVFGRYFSEITADPVQTPFGEYRGGYAPAVVDTFLVQDAAVRAQMEKVNDSNSYTFPATNKGFTMSRVEYNAPLALDLRLMLSHIDKVLLFSHVEAPVRDVMRLLNSRGVKTAIERYNPALYTDMLLPWLNRSAKQIVEIPSTGWAGKMLDHMARTVRSRAGAALMFANVVNTLQQVTGFQLARLKVKRTYMNEALIRYTRSPREMAQEVAELSKFMATRMESETNILRGEINDILLNPSAYEKVKDWTNKHAYIFQTTAQNVVDTVVWTGAYNQALANGLDERAAVRDADAAIRLTQGSSLPEDISRYEAGTAFTRLFTQFAGYFNMQFNLLRTETTKLISEYGVRQSAAPLFFIALYGFLAPAWTAGAIRSVLYGGPDDDDDDGYLDEFMLFLFGEPFANATAMVPVAGQAITSGVSAFNDKPYDDRLRVSPGILLVESAVKAPALLTKYAESDAASAKGPIRSSLDLITLTTGVPVSVLGRPAGYLADVSSGRVQPTSGADFARGLVTGVASPESK